MNETRELIGRWLAVKRQIAGMTLHQAASRTNISDRELRTIEEGEKHASNELIDRLVDVYDVSWADAERLAFDVMNPMKKTSTYDFN